MPGLAKTAEFMLGTATVMIGPVADLYNLSPATHSIGLVKNFVIMSEPGYTELTQGVKNSIVHSIMTSNAVRCTMEALEFTSANLAYALGLDGSGVAANTVATTLSSAVLAAATTAPVVSATGIVANDYVMFIQGDDDFIVRKVVSVATNTLTLDRALPAIANGSVVKKVNHTGIGSKDDQPFLAAKIAGKLASGEQVVIFIPKIRITKGFNLAFTTDNYANLPLEFTVYDLVSTDTFYAEFGGLQAKLFRK